MNLQSIKQRFSIIGRSSVLDNALSTAVRVASTDLTVLITGESGVGKEVFSKIIHGLSPRKHSTFIAINCGAIPEGTINSELFGHEKGSFTGATGERKGYFETVNGGTIFLDEISEMPMDTQAFLLRIIESGEFIRVGSSKVLKTDVRIIAATNIDLLEKVRNNKFREDLYYRLNTVPIHVSPLRQRREDIWMLFRKFVLDFSEKYGMAPIELTPEAKLLLENYSWPGNIRELKNMAEQISVLSESREINADQLRSFIPGIETRHLPALNTTSNGNESIREREILYKLLFDMKADLNDLKSLVYELIQNNNLSVPDADQLKQLAPAQNAHPWSQVEDYPYDASAGSESEKMEKEFIESKELKPVVIEHAGSKRYDPMEIVEESLSIEKMEKELIKKALKKHNGRRKDAAEDLGISERTLYRKIKQYEL